MVDRRTSDFTMGIEEEYLLVDAVSRDLVPEPPAELIERCEAKVPGQISAEFLRSQIEVQTHPCRSLAQARDEIRRLRSTVAEVAHKFGLAPIAASTHPFGHWSEQVHTPKKRYDALAEDFAGAARRLVICGMHTHVGVEDPDTRIDLMNQVTYFLPHLLALSSSSPFWQGNDMGMRSYRLSVFDELPRTGLPDKVESFAEFRRLESQLVSAGLVEDASMLWWDVRPSIRFPTLEQRITDICTRVEDCLTISALYLSILGMLSRLRGRNQRWRVYPSTLLMENRWRAQRFGASGELVDFGRSTLVPFKDLVGELLELVEPELDLYHCRDEVERVHEILEQGTSAQKQLATYAQAIEAGKSKDDALKAVVDDLIKETVRDL